MLDFVLITPIYHGVDGVTCWCVEKAHQAGLNNFLWIVGSAGKGDALICRERSVAATAFMEFGESNYMIFLDSDIVFSPQQLYQLHQDQKEGYDIVGGMYPYRNGQDWSTYFFNGESPNELGVHEVQYLATGFMGISKFALQKITKEYKYGDIPMPILHPNTPDARSYPFFEAKWWHMDKVDADHKDLEGKGFDIWLSEDYDFCEKARAVGLKVYADTRIQLAHQGNYLATPQMVMENKIKKMRKDSQDETIAMRLAGVEQDYVTDSAEGAEC